MHPDDGQNPYYGGGGGGFVAGSQGSQDSPGGRKAKGGNTTIRPVTVKQVLNAAQVHPDSDFTIDGVEVGSVLIVGSVRNRSVTATNVQYEVGDGTGYVDVRQWLDSADDEAGKMDGIEQEKYVSIMGSIKTFGGKRHISATHIRLITNHDEVYHHLLKALYISLNFRYPYGGGGGGGAATRNDYNAGGVTNGGMESAYGALPPLQRKIMEVVAGEDSEDGMHVSLVTKQVGNSSGEEVMEAIEHLMSEGMLFSTIDDLHIKAV